VYYSAHELLLFVQVSNWDGVCFMFFKASEVIIRSVNSFLKIDIGNWNKLSITMNQLISFYVS
jgi:hypothetical protein